MTPFPEFTIDELILLRVAPSRVNDHTNLGFNLLEEALENRISVRDYILDCAEALDGRELTDLPESP